MSANCVSQRMNYRLSRFIVSVFVGFFMQSAMAETVTIGGVGALTPLVAKLAEKFSKQNPAIEVVITMPPIGTAGSVRALAAGKIDIALSGRAAKAGETDVFYPWLRTPLVLATSDGKASKGLSKMDVADIFAGRRNEWEDGKPMRLILRSENETEMKSIRAISPEIDAAAGEALKRPGLPVAENDLEALELLSKTKGSLGSTALGLIKSNGAALKVINIEGQTPSLAALENGKYGLQRAFYLVSNATLKPAASVFLNYLKSPQALKEAALVEFGPLRP
jgi:phosphate transport system substrate-binding protein